MSLVILSKHRPFMIVSGEDLPKEEFFKEEKTPIAYTGRGLQREIRYEIKNEGGYRTWVA